jgi:hypothetical protein
VLAAPSNVRHNIGAVRWLAGHLSDAAESQDDRIRTTFAIAVACLFTCLLSIPFLAWLADSLIWTAVWLVRRPVVRRWLRRWPYQRRGPFG